MFKTSELNKARIDEILNKNNINRKRNDYRLHSYRTEAQENLGRTRLATAKIYWEKFSVGQTIRYEYMVMTHRGYKKSTLPW